MKVLMHAINGIGLGHIIRTLEVAKALREMRGTIDIVFVTNSRFPDPIKEEGFRFYQLEPNTKDVLDKNISYQDYLESNAKHITRIIDKECPDLVLFDCEINPPIIDFCLQNKIKTALTLRNTLKERLMNIIREGILSKIDLILVPHHENELEDEQRTALKELNNVLFIGPIIREKKDIEPEKKEAALRILITFSSGSDIQENQPLFKKVSEFLRYLNDNSSKVLGKSIRIDLITGPFFKHKSFNLYGFDYREFDPNLIGSLEKADLIISPAGYNTANEIIYTRTPALFIPVKRQGDDQFSRARRLHDMGCAKIVEDSILKIIEDIVKGEIDIKKMKDCFPSLHPGNKKAAIELVRLLGFRKKIAILRSNWLPLSERFIFDELDSLEFHEPYIFCLHKESPHKSSFKYIYDEGFEGLWNKEFPFIKNKQIKLYEEYITWCASKIKSAGIRLLHAPFLTDALFFLKLKKLTNLPLIVSVRGHDIYSTDKMNFSNLLKGADLFLVRSDTMKDELISLGGNPKKIKVHHSAIRISEKPPETKITKNLRILMVGRFVEKKATLLGIEIFNKACERFDNISMTIVGDGPLKEEVLKKKNQSLFSEKIDLLGELPNKEVLEIMSRCQILLHPSITAIDGDKEGIPNSIMEAISLGLIVVSSDNGSIPEIIEDKKTGFTFKENSLDQAIRTLSMVLRIKDLRKIQQAAFEKVKREFDIKKQTEKIEMIYDGFLRAREDFNRFDRYYTNYIEIQHTDTPTSFRVDIHPIRGCNSGCIICDNWKNEVKGFFSIDKLKELIDDLEKIGIDEIRFHGQEPTLFKKLPLLVQYAKSKDIRIGLKTNANNLDQEYCKGISQVDKIYLSIDSPDKDIHNKLRGNLSSFDNNINAINYLRKYSNNISIESNAVVTNLNYKSLVYMPDFAFDNQIDKISFVLPNSKNKKDIFSLTLQKEQLEEFFLGLVPKIIKKCIKYNLDFDFSPFFAELVLESPLKQAYDLKHHPSKFTKELKDYANMDYGLEFFKKYGCYSQLDHLTINYEGSVFPCCVVERTNSNRVGDIIDSNFHEIWGSKKYLNLRKDTIRTNGMLCQNSIRCGSNFEIRKALAKRINELQSKDEIEALSSLQELNNFLFCDNDTLNNIKEKKLRHIIAFCLDKIPFYKNQTYRNKIIDAHLTLSSFNLLDKQEVRNSIYNGMINEDYIESPALILDRTSGSIDTSVPFAYMKGFDRYIRMVYPFMIHSDWKWGEEYLTFTTLHCSRERCSSEDLPYYVKRKKIPTSDDIFKDKRALTNAFNILTKNPNSLLHADPYYLLALALYINKNYKKIKLRAISSTYELLLPGIKNYLESTFQCNVFDSYGSSEFGPISFSCEKGNQHIFENSVNIEIIEKGRYLDPRVGEIIATSLDNKVMPLIRYRTGDLGRTIQKKCACGRNSTIIEIFGRKERCLILNNTRYTEKDVAGLMDIQGVLVYQIFRKENLLSLLILPSENSNEVFIEEKIRDNFGKVCDLEIDVVFVDSITPEGSGKFSSIKHTRCA